MNIDKIKKEFPIFDEKIQNNDLVYLDSANSSQKPKVVLDRINDFYSKQFSNVGRSLHYLAVAATNLYENTRSSVQKYINAKDKNEIVFTKGATEALNLVANTLGQTILEPNDEVLITELEHHSNYVPWHFLRQSKNIKIKFAEINDDLNTDISASVTRDNSTFDAITLTDEGYVTGASGTKIFTGDTPLTGASSPQVRLRWKITGANLSNLNTIHGVSLQWK